MAELRTVVEPGPNPLITSFNPTPYPGCSAAASSDYPGPDLTGLLRLPCPLATSLQFLALSLGSLEGFRMAIQGLRKSCHSPHHPAQLPGLNLVSESLQEAIGVPANLLDP